MSTGVSAWVTRSSPRRRPPMTPRSAGVGERRSAPVLPATRTDGNYAANIGTASCNMSQHQCSCAKADAHWLEHFAVELRTVGQSADMEHTSRPCAPTHSAIMRSSSGCQQEAAVNDWLDNANNVSAEHARETRIRARIHASSIRWGAIPNSDVRSHDPKQSGRRSDLQRG